MKENKDIAGKEPTKPGTYDKGESLEGEDTVADMSEDVEHSEVDSKEVEVNVWSLKLK